MPDRANDLYLHLGVVLGLVLREETAEAFVAVLGSDAEYCDRVWRYTQALRDRLTELLQRAGREC